MSKSSDSAIHPGLAYLAFGGLSTTVIGIGLARFAYTPLIPAMINAGWFSEAAVLYLGAANLFGYLLGALSAHWAAVRLGAPRLIRLSLVLSAISFLACAQPLGFGWLFLWRLLAGVTGAWLMVVASAWVLHHAPIQRRGLVGAFMFSGIGVGVIASGTLVPSLAAHSVAAAWIILGICTAALAAASWRAWADEPVHEEQGGAAATRLRLSWPIALVMLAYALDALGFIPHTLFWVDYIARGLGRGLAAGGMLWVVLGLGALMGPLAVGAVADRIGFRTAFGAALLLKGCCVALPLLSSATWVLALSSFGVGALVPGTVALASGRIGALVGRARMRQGWGWMTAAFAASQAASGYGMSYLYELLHSYQPLFVISSLALAVAAVAAWSAPGHIEIAAQGRTASVMAEE